MEAVEAGILCASWEAVEVRIADSLTVSSRLKLGADVTREAVQGVMNSKIRLPEARRTRDEAVSRWATRCRYSCEFVWVL